MKKILVMVFALNGFLCASPASEKGYEIVNDEVLVYRNRDIQALVFGGVLGVLFGVVPITICLTEPHFYSSTSGKLIGLGFSSLSAASMALGIRAYNRSCELQETPIVRLSKDGLYCEGYPFYTWDELGPLCIQETISEGKAIGRTLCFPIKNKRNEYVNLNTGYLVIEISALMNFIARYIHTLCLSSDEMHDSTPLYLQKTIEKLITYVLQKTVGDLPGFVPSCVQKIISDTMKERIRDTCTHWQGMMTVQYCMKKGSHDCALTHLDSESLGIESRVLVNFAAQCKDIIASAIKEISGNMPLYSYGNIQDLFPF